MCAPNIKRISEVLGTDLLRLDSLGASKEPFRGVILAIVLALCLNSSHTLAAQELQQVRGKFIEVVTDLPIDEDAEKWPELVDAAVPLFCSFWQVAPQRVEGWKVTAYVMSAKEPFRRRGLIPEVVPDFPHGFQFGNQVFLLKQPSTYYTSHLLLHEVAHALAFHLFGGAGPPWFMEGTAEFLATHRWTGNGLEIGIVPDRKQAFPYWGRFKMIDQRRSEQKALSLMGVLRFNQGADRFVEPYAWTWAALQLFNAYPEYRKLVIESGPLGNDGTVEFTKRFYQTLGDDWQVAQSRWRVLIDEFDYGFDWSRNRLDIDLRNSRWNDQPLQLAIAANAGWQSAGIIFTSGSRLKIEAQGQITLGNAPRPWNSTPDGITYRYHRGIPIGKLIATLLPVDPGKQQTIDPLVIQEVNRETTLQPSTDSWLLLRVNENLADLNDNSGEYQVHITP